jgi:pimeloyl-ACP methyl ester carboxylesterase
VSALGDHERAGAGEPLLLLHGYTATWRAWGPVVPLLAESFDVLAVTLPGHFGGPELPGGDSISILVDRLEAMLDEVGWDRPHVAGFSLGGWLAFELAKRGRARTVTAFSPGGATTERQEREARRIKWLFANSWFGAWSIMPLLDELCRRPGFRRWALADQMIHGDRTSPQEARTLITGLARMPLFWRFWREIGTPPGLEHLETVDVPTTVAWAEKDRTLPQRLHEQFFRDRLPHADFRPIPYAGHVPFWDQTDAVVETVRSRGTLTT